MYNVIRDKFIKCVDEMECEMMVYLDHQLDKKAYPIKNNPQGLYERHVLDMVWFIMLVRDKRPDTRSMYDSVCTVLGFNLLDIIGDLYSPSTRLLLEQKLSDVNVMTLGLYSSVVAPITHNDDVSSMQCIAIAMLLYILDGEPAYIPNMHNRKLDAMLENELTVFRFRAARTKVRTSYEQDIKIDPLEARDWIMTYGVIGYDLSLTNNQLGIAMTNKVKLFGCEALYHYIYRGSPYECLYNAFA